MRWLRGATLFVGQSMAVNGERPRLHSQADMEFLVWKLRMPAQAFRIASLAGRRCFDLGAISGSQAGKGNVRCPSSHQRLKKQPVAMVQDEGSLSGE